MRIIRGDNDVETNGKLALHNRLLCNANRNHRGLTNNPICNECDNVEETILHILRDCKVAQQWLIRNLEANGVAYPEMKSTYFGIT
ncbi:hypothetical protein RDABS01_015992 [Bienertia sinuspersici]